MSMNKSDKGYKLPVPVIKLGDAVPTAISLIRDEMSGKQTGLFSRFSNLNAAIGKYFRPGNLVVISGLSGGAKSLLLNMLLQDFQHREDIVFEKELASSLYLGNKVVYEGSYTTKEGKVIDGKLYDSNLFHAYSGEVYLYGLNRWYDKEVIEIHFGLEMAPEIELIRTACNIMGTNFSHAVSSDRDKDGSYVKLTDESFSIYEKVLNRIGQKKQYYINVSGSIADFDETVCYIARLHPNATLVISIDHGFLVLKEEGHDDNRLVEQVAQYGHKWKTNFKALVFLIMQANNEIEKRTNKAEHYPKKSDIFNINRIWWAADYVLFIHIPKSLGITKYGPLELNTQELVHLSLIKGRNVPIGHTWFIDDLRHTRLLPASSKYFLPNKNKSL